MLQFDGAAGGVRDQTTLFGGEALPTKLPFVPATVYCLVIEFGSTAEHDEVVTPAQLPPVHVQLVAAGLQLALRVIGVPFVPVEGPVTVHTGALDTMQVSVRFPGVPVSWKSLQLVSLRVMVAWANAPADMRASAAAVHASAAQRVNDRII
jgi:hypothetical protein